MSIRKNSHFKYKVALDILDSDKELQDEITSFRKQKIKDDENFAIELDYVARTASHVLIRDRKIAKLVSDENFIHALEIYITTGRKEAEEALHTLPYGVEAWPIPDNSTDSMLEYLSSSFPKGYIVAFSNDASVSEVKKYIEYLFSSLKKAGKLKPLRLRARPSHSQNLIAYKELVKLNQLTKKELEKITGEKIHDKYYAFAKIITNRTSYKFTATNLENIWKRYKKRSFT